MSCFSLSCRIVTLNCLHLFKLLNLFTCVSLFDLSWPFHVFFLRWSVGRSLWKRLSCYHAWHFWFSGLFIFSQFPGRIYPFFLSAVFCSSFSLPVLVLNERNTLYQSHCPCLVRLDMNIYIEPFNGTVWNRHLGDYFDNINLFQISKHPF